jgi:hypothetical protein
MKKAFLLLIVAAMTGVLGFKVSAADAGSITAKVYSELFTDAAAGKQVPARIITGENLQNLDCVTTEDPGEVSCQFPDKYAGQQITFELTKDKVMYIYIINLQKN